MTPPSPVKRLALTPAGALHAFAQGVPDAAREALQSVLSGLTLPSPEAWAQHGPAHAQWLSHGLAAGWLQVLHREWHAPEMRLEDLLPRVIAGLSGERKAALATAGGFCAAHHGFLLSEAEALCAAAADFTEFARRQHARGWLGAGELVSFHRDPAMLIPTVSFVPFWIDGVDHCLVLAGEPLINNPAFVELIWAIKTAGSRFARRAAARPDPPP